MSCMVTGQNICNKLIKLTKLTKVFPKRSAQQRTKTVRKCVTFLLYCTCIRNTAVIRLIIISYFFIPHILIHPFIF